jgi:entericidin B
MNQIADNQGPDWMLSDRTLNQIRNTTMRKNLPIILALFALVAAAPILSACQTTAGAGEDISAGGKALTKSAEKHAP